ncbi:hypothetical protein [Streptacidiphilus sp. MAP5-3]
MASTDTALKEAMLTGAGLFLYLALDRQRANQVMARRRLLVIEQGLEV